MAYSQDILDVFSEASTPRLLGVDLASLTHRVTEDYKLMLSKKKADENEQWGNTSWFKCRSVDDGFAVGDELTGVELS